MELILLAILITLLGWWPVVGILLLTGAVIFGLFLVIVWISDNWNKKVKLKK